jgi:hypothetical protein
VVSSSSNISYTVERAALAKLLLSRWWVRASVGGANVDVVGGRTGGMDCRLPRVGDMTFDSEDAAMVVLALIFLAFGTATLVRATSVGDIVTALLLFIFGGSVVLVTIRLGLDRVYYERWGDPIGLSEALRNHALAEGY